jgi:hypothetical protein
MLLMRIARLAAAALFSLAAVHAVRLTIAESRGLPHDSPRSSAAWIAIGLAAEESGSVDAAEHALLEAARIDHQYVPAWTLANFYFRRADPAHFWPWAQIAARLAYDDLAPLLQLADALDPDPAHLLDRLGDTPALHRAYLDFLIGRNRLDAAQIVARRMEGEPDSPKRVADLHARMRAHGP